MAKPSYSTGATHCPHGHDVTAPGSLETGGSRNKQGKRCVECRRERDRLRSAARRKQRGNICPRGHKLTGKNLRVVKRVDGVTLRLCETCIKAAYTRGVGKPEDVTRERHRTRAILWLDEMRERAATWWEREVFAQRKAILLGAAAQ